MLCADSSLKNTISAASVLLKKGHQGSIGLSRVWTKKNRDSGEL